MSAALYIQFEDEIDKNQAYYLHWGSAHWYFNPLKDYIKDYITNHKDKKKFIENIKTLRTESQKDHNQFIFKQVIDNKIFDIMLGNGLITHKYDSDMASTLEDLNVLEENVILIPKVGHKVTFLGYAINRSYGSQFYGYRGKIDHIYLEDESRCYIKPY